MVPCTSCEEALNLSRVPGRMSAKSAGLLCDSVAVNEVNKELIR